MKTTKNIREISLLIGIIAGFTFLVSFLAGIGAAGETTFLAAVFLAVITVAVTPLLFAADQK